MTRHRGRNDALANLALCAAVGATAATSPAVPPAATEGQLTEQDNPVVGTGSTTVQVLFGPPPGTDLPPLSDSQRAQLERAIEHSFHPQPALPDSPADTSADANQTPAQPETLPFGDR